METNELYESEKKVNSSAASIAVGQDGAISVAMRHLVPVHEPQRSGGSLSPGVVDHHHQVSVAGNPQGPKSHFSTGRWWPSDDDLSYPGIPFQVARCLFESSPDVLQTMEAALHRGGTRLTGDQRSTFNHCPSALLQMATTTDALALQESVIAPPDVVPQVADNIINNRRRAEEHRVTPTATQEAFIDASTSKSATAIAGQGALLDASPLQINSDKRIMESSERLLLHRFPPDRITTVVEKRSWLSAIPKEEVVPRTWNRPEMVLDNASSRDGSVRSLEDGFVVSSPGPAGTVSPKATFGSEDTDARSVMSEVESTFSERYELDSNFSERLELQSNMSEVSGLEEEMFRIKKLLLEVPGLQDASSADGVGANMQSYLDLLREKAALEGQLDALKVQVEAVTKERSQVQAQVTTFRAQVATHMGLARSAKREVDDLYLKLNSADKRYRDAEDLLEKLRATVLAKSEEVDRCREEARSSEAEAQRDRIALQELKVDAELKDGAIRGLKSKIAEIHVNLHSAVQAKATAENDLQGVKNELVSERKMKEWYHQQLQECLAAKGKVQQLAISLQTTKDEQETLAEKLRFERDQVKLQLAESQQRAVKEKVGLLRRLEGIEADMRERESTYLQLSSDRGLVNDTLLSQMKKIEEERAQLAEDNLSKVELERQLEASRSECASKGTALNKSEKEVAQLAKHLTILQKSLAEKDLEMQLLQEGQVRMDTKHKELQVSLQAKEGMLASAVREKAVLEGQLTSCKRDKEDTDAALGDVRETILKLDGRLKQMRVELSARTASIEELKREKQEVEEGVKVKEAVWGQQIKRLEKAEEETRQLREELGNALQGSLHQSEQLSEAKETVQRLSADLDRLVTENASLRNSVESSAANSYPPNANARLVRELEEAKRLLVEREEELRELGQINEELNKNVLVLEEVRVGLQDESLKTATSGNRRTESSSHVSAAEMTERVKMAETKVLELEKENQGLKDRLEEVDKRAGGDAEVVFGMQTQEFGTQTEGWAHGQGDAEKNYLKMKTVQLECALHDAQKEACSRYKRYESNISTLTRKLKEALKIKKKLEDEVKSVGEKISENNTGFVQTAEQTNALQNHSEAGKSKDTKIRYFRKRITLMESKISEIQRLYMDERRRADRSQEMLIELEKQKGKLHALAESSSVLKQQTTELEAALSERETIMSEMDVNAKSMETRQKQEEAHLKDLVSDLQTKLTSEQETCRELRKQIFKEKCESSGLKKQVCSLKSGLEETNCMVDTKRIEMQSLDAELEAERQASNRLTTEMNEVQARLKQRNNEVERFRKELEELRAKDPLLADQIKTLSWHLKQKNHELESLKQQGRLVEERHGAQLARLEQSLQNINLELSSVRAELQSALEEKVSYQNKLMEMRLALKSSHEKNKVLQLQFSMSESKIGSLPDFKIPESPAPYDEARIASLLEQSLSLPESKPLSNLHVCLNTLKHEMSILQQQLLDQTDMS